MPGMNFYHAHVYFPLSELPSAQRFYDLAQKEARDQLEVYKIFPQKVGPHALPMIELRFDDTTKQQATEWIDKHRGTFSVLIHQDTGDDYQDHSNGVQWLGEALPIDFGFFDRVQQNPSEKVH